MKRLLILITGLAAIGSIAWALAAMAVQTTAARWLDGERIEGVVVNAADVSVSGFPLTFQTAFTDLQLANPETPQSWTAPRLQLEQQVFRLDRLTARFPETQRFSLPAEQLTLTSAEMVAHLDLSPTANLALDRASGEISDMTVSSTLGWDLALNAGDFVIERTAEAGHRYTLSLTIHDVRLPATVARQLDPDTALPEQIDTLTGRVRVRFDAPWDRAAIEGPRPQPTEVEIEDLAALWGGMLFRATGTLNVTAGGVPEGVLDIRAENWRDMVDLAQNSGLLPERFRPTADGMLQVLADMNGSPDNIDASLNFSNGQVFLGPLPIGPAPILRIP